MIKRKFGMYRLGYIPPIQSKYNVTLEQLNNVIEEWIKMDSSSNEKIRFFDKFGNQKSWSIEEEDGETEIKFELKNGGKKDGVEYKIVKRDATRFDIRREQNKKKSYILAEKTADGYKFTYSNGYSETV